MSDQRPSPPSISNTRCDDFGRNGVISVLPSSTSCSATCRIVFIRSGSDSRSFHGAWSDRYLLASPSVRLDSVIAALNQSRQAFDAVGEALARPRFKAAITESMPTLGEANKDLPDQAPGKLRETDP